MIVKPLYCLYAAAGVMIGADLFRTQLFDTDMFLIVLSAFLLCASFHLFNAVATYERDRAYRMQSPLVQGIISKELIVRIGIILLLLTLLMTAAVNYYLLVLTVISIGLIIYYNIQGRERFPLNMLIVPFLGSISFLAGTLIYNSVSEVLSISNPILPMAMAFVLLLINELLSDCHTMDADRTFGRPTLPVKIGIPYSMTASLIITTLLAAVVSIPVLLDYYSDLYKIIAVYITILPFSALMILVWGKPNTTMLSWASYAVKIALAFGLAALFGA